MADRSVNLIDHVTPTPSESNSGQQVATLAPRPAAPTQRLTARTFAWPEDGEADAPIERALGAYGYDQWDAHAADRAFGEDLPGGSAA